MKKLLITLLILSTCTVHASQNSPESKEPTKYTYEQGLELSFAISQCFVDDEGIVNLSHRLIKRFKKETGSYNIVIMLLAMRISRQYRIQMMERYIPDEDERYIKSVVERCREGVEVEPRQLKN